MPGIALIKIAENYDVTNFTPTAKTEGTRAIFFLPSFVLYFPTRKRTGTPTRDLGFGREVAFCFVGSALLGNFAPKGVRNAPFRVRVRLARKRNEDEEADEKASQRVSIVVVGSRRRTEKTVVMAGERSAPCARPDARLP